MNTITNYLSTYTDKFSTEAQVNTPAKATYDALHSNNRAQHQQYLVDLLYHTISNHAEDVAGVGDYDNDEEIEQNARL